MDTEISCNLQDPVCKARHDKIQAWASNYKDARDKYLSAYKAYLEESLQGSNTSNATKTNMDNAQRDVQRILSELSSQTSASNSYLSDNSNQIRLNQDKIQKNNSDITNQDNSINKLNISLLSKERQIEYTNERNRNRRIMVAVLIIINLILIFVAYTLYNK